MHLVVFQKRNYQVFWSSFGSIAVAWSVALWSCVDMGLEILPILQRMFACYSKTAITTIKQNVKFVQTFFINHLIAIRPTLGHWQGGSLTHPTLITTLFQARPERHGEPCNAVRFQSLTERISRIRAGNLPILSMTCYPTVSLFLKVY